MKQKKPKRSDLTPAEAAGVLLGYAHPIFAAAKQAKALTKLDARLGRINRIVDAMGEVVCALQEIATEQFDLQYEQHATVRTIGKALARSIG